ncbi:hypothetical protein MTR_2g088210 [Medicago truncatula]|uniref:Uncharacterized protein n=1 Tax=Medicago truncatula TaxID=3880 RepID=G7ITY0_MEDTR|nr:hypothetical protein MTR_2g088210 [Medicago truncatula]
MENNVGMWKQEIMMMEIENEVFDSSETDLDYEFDAPRFFDFTAQQQQSLTQLPQPERWFRNHRNLSSFSFVLSFNFSSLSLFSK